MRTARHKSGFTLIELMVSVGLFSVVMLIASTAYLTVSAANKQAQALASATNVLSFALENMSRTIRTSTGYLCGAGNCPYPGGGTAFTVTTPAGTTVQYSYDAANKTILSNGVAIVDSSVQITGLTFYAEGTAAGDSTQSHVTIVVSGTVSGAHNVLLPFTVETSATMRGSDI